MTLDSETPSRPLSHMDDSEILAPEDAFSETLECILQKWNVPLVKKGGVPTEIPNITRKDLANLFAALGFCVGAEIGVDKGVYSEVLCKANPGLELYCVDSWDQYEGYTDFVGVEPDERYNIAKRRLEKYNCKLIKALSEDAAGVFADGSLDFVYIDGNHDFFHFAQDLHFWSTTVRPGGIIAGHDYRKLRSRRKKLHVPYVLPAWTSAYSIIPWFVCGTASNLETRDKFRSWFWIQR